MAAPRVADGAKCLAGKKDRGTARQPGRREGPAGESSPQALVLGRELSECYQQWDRYSNWQRDSSPDWLKFKNPETPAVKREAEEDWGR
jgi:hypothetical protein